MVFGRSTLAGFFASALLATGAVAAPRASSEKERRQTAPLAVTGVQGTGVQPRLEIRTLESQNPDQWNVYLLGLYRMQRMDQADFQSYFQIAGIHGLPMADWNGVRGDPNTNPASGYCTHVSNMFLPWHRPYMALYEQILQQNAMDAAQEFQGEEQSRYVAAAQALRSPYWDWAMNPNGGNAIPDSMTTPTISVRTPGGDMTIDNPLYSYIFHPVDQGLIYSPFTYWDRTYRHPWSQEQWPGNDDGGLRNTMNGQQPGLANRMFNLFANYRVFTNVSTSAWYQGMSGNYDSIESIHDTVHGLVGGGNNGHMSIIDVSAFDPVFWLHHMAVDRFFALWQALYPDSYVEPQSQIYGSYWYSPGTVLDAGTPLYPFHSDTAGNFHTSNSVRDPTTFGYTYPELQSGNPQDIITSVNTLYGANQAMSRKRSTSNPLSKLTGAVNDLTNNVTDALGPVGDVVEGVVSETSDIVSSIGSYLGVSSPREYLVNVRSDKSALDGSYMIYIFIGDVPAEPCDWNTADTLVGIQAITSMYQGSQMGSAIVAGSIPLTRYLEKNVVLKLLSGLSEDLVVPYLTEHLSWRVLGSDKTEIPASALPDTKVSVVSTAIKRTDSLGKFPEWVDGFTSHKSITSGKDFGLCESDDE